MLSRNLLYEFMVKLSDLCFVLHSSVGDAVVDSGLARGSDSVGVFVEKVVGESVGCQGRRVHFYVRLSFLNALDSAAVCPAAGCFLFPAGAF